MIDRLFFSILLIALGVLGALTLAEGVRSTGAAPGRTPVTAHAGAASGVAPAAVVELERVIVRLPQAMTLAADAQSSNRGVR